MRNDPEQTLGKQHHQASEDAGKEVEEAARYLAAIVQSASDAIVGATLDWIIVSWNAGAERLFGYSAEAAVGRELWLVIPEDQIIRVSGFTVSSHRNRPPQPQQR